MGELVSSMNSGSLRRVAKIPLRALVLARKGKDKPLNGLRQRSEAAVAKHSEPLMGMIAHGQVPMDETTAQAVGAYLDQQHKKMTSHA